MDIKLDLGKKHISMLRAELAHMRCEARISIDDPKHPEIVTIRGIKDKEQRGLANQGFNILEEA